MCEIKIHFKMYFSVIGVLLLCGGAFSHTYHLGACPIVEPMPGFEMNEVIFKYNWFLIEKKSQILRFIFIILKGL